MKKIVFVLLAVTLAAWLPIPGGLTGPERRGLQFMREEEKLARDVYGLLFRQYGLHPFQQISRSEQMHMDAVGSLLLQYRLSDPAAGRDTGFFYNDTLQHLYRQLVARAQTGIVEALRVSAYIEELDIRDLNIRLGQTKNGNITAVYERLRYGSHNHLRAFVRNLERRSETYSPVLLNKAEYDSILAQPGQGPRPYERRKGYRN